MIDIKLYEGCWVKTEAGQIVGPLKLSTSFTALFEGPGTCWHMDGGNVTPDLSWGYDDATVIAVYASLSEAAAANPEM